MEQFRLYVLFVTKATEMIGELSTKVVTDIRVSNPKGNIRRFYQDIGELLQP